MDRQSGIDLVIGDDAAQPDLVADPLDRWQEIPELEVFVAGELVLPGLPELSLLELDPGILKLLIDVQSVSPESVCLSNGRL